MRLHRLRHLGLTLVFAILASVGADVADGGGVLFAGAAASAGSARIKAPATGAASAGATASEASAAALSERHYGIPPAVLGEATPTVELGRRDGGSPLLRLTPRVLRTRFAEPISGRSAEPAATRARDVERLRLDFAAALAEARAGLLSARSTAPPPPHLS